MYNLSLTACSFYLKTANSRGVHGVFDLNKAIEFDCNGNIRQYSVFDLFYFFLREHSTTEKDPIRRRSFSCEYKAEWMYENEDFHMIYAKILSGEYGSSALIRDGNTNELKYSRSAEDIEIRPFYFFVVIPKNTEEDITVQKGLLIFQNVGAYGIKTVTTEYLQKFFSQKLNITLEWRTIAPALFVEKSIRKDNTKKLILIKNRCSSDDIDNTGFGYGYEQREVGNFTFSDTSWSRLKDKISYFLGDRTNLFEFAGVQYDSAKVDVEIGGRIRRINLHNIDRVSIIEPIPDEIRMADGHPNEKMLVDYIANTAQEYLSEMVFQIS